ncbi:MAG: SurA N-terminal domain-containing protein [Oscillospiraceae bacterium]|jgi:hypothetical protein|nr:SurA N-terminal domain-containing protein [Oscillospiraceae bacterium]
MSASRERKNRAQQDMPAAKKSAKKKKKLNEGAVFAICFISILVLVIGGIIGYRAYWRCRPIVTIGDHEITAAQFNYYYRGAVDEMYNSYGSYLSMFGLDTSKGLKEQSAGADADGKDVSWAESFADTAQAAVVAQYTMYDMAMADGFVLSEEIKADLEAEIEAVKGYAAQNGLSADDYLEAIYGKGATLESFREYQTVAHTYSEYVNAQTHTDEEIAARYAAEPTDFDTVSYNLYTVKASDFVEAAEDGTTPAVTDAERTEAKEAAEKMVSAFDADDEKVTRYDYRTKEEVTSATTEDAANWLYTEADLNGTFVKLFNNEDTYYVLQLIDYSDNDYDTANILQLFIADDAEDAVLAEGDLTAQERVDAVTAALKENSSEENFLALVEQYTDSTADASKLSGVSRRDSSIPEVVQWLFDKTPKVGDYDIFAIDGGTYFLMYTGAGENYKHHLVEEKLTEEWYNAAIEAAVYVYDAKAAMHANVDLILNEIYGS